MSTYLKGKILVSQGEYNSAQEIFKGLIVNNPNNIRAHNALAYSYVKSGDLVSAKVVNQKALTINPDNGIALFMKLKIAIYSGDWEFAKECGPKFIQSNGSLKFSHLVLLCALYDEGHPILAVLQDWYTVEAIAAARKESAKYNKYKGQS